MYLLLLPLLFFAADALPFIAFTAFKDCPNIPIQENLSIDQVAGSWRLAYLFYDEQDDIEEDNTCIITEFAPLNDNQMTIAVHMDFRADDFVVDRSSFDLFASFNTPGEWMLHSNTSHKAYIHVKVISFTRHHMVLTFCISNETDTDNYTHGNLGYDYILQKLRNDDNSRYYKKRQRFGQGEFDDEVNALFARKNFLRKKRSLIEKLALDEDSNLLKKESKSEDNNSKHFWTVILVKDNNISAYNFVENASLLMKLGFDVRQGNFVSFGKCTV
ncbi:UNVERIFIED_CONTAM: hypothetical protein PYX00_002458 [Menopon gallinae]|uniref:Uncharacterized protein n=1 Tax=Menopon gallinae TaxID=328185 RepID=A0AAW2II75_9NEOP